MKRLILISAILFSLCYLIQAQAPVPIKIGPSLPSTCSVNAKRTVLFYKTGASNGLYYCSAANTWTALGSGGVTVGVTASNGTANTVVKTDGAGHLADATGVTNATGTPLKVTSQAASDIPITIQGAASQSGHFIDITSSGGSAGDLFQILPQSTGVRILGGTGNGNYIQFGNGNQQYGDVVGDGSAGVQYNSSSYAVLRDNGGDVGTKWFTGGWWVATPNKRLTSSPTNLTATMSNLTDLTLNVKASQVVTITYNLIANDSTAAEGIKFDMGGGSATFTSIEFVFVATPPGVTLGTVQSTTSTTAITATTATTTDVVYQIYVTAVINAAGTFIPRFAQVSHTSGTATVKIGSSGMAIQPSN